VTTSDASTGVLRRDREEGWVGGVAAGIARRFGVDPSLVRVAFVVAAAAGGVGVAAYLLGWLVIPAGDSRPARVRIRTGRAAVEVALGTAFLLLAVLLAFRALGIWFSDAIVWPLVLIAGGGALIWRQSTAPAKDADVPQAAPAARREMPIALRLPADAVSRALLGAALVVGGGLVFLWLNNALQPARDVLLAVVVVLITLTLILAPWWLRLVRGLSAERAERIRSQERSELAAHLHDSVLQTLALVQKRADDPRAVANLARRQERELRAWLDGGRPDPGESLAASLEAAAAEVEETHGVPIDVVAVGDAPVDERGAALVAAVREALVNAAKFAGGAPVQLYAEVGEERTEVFVRDRGPGFDPEAVPEDRRGLRESIYGRMDRHGGRAVVHSAPGAGTEVELVIER
jgi:signal transduction histidine kinase